MTQQHIDDETLDLFVRVTSLAEPVSTGAGSMSDSSYENVLDHLTGCETCREQVTALSTLQTQWSRLPHPSGLSDEQQQLICDYIDGLLQPEQANNVKTLIDEQPDAMKAALHYQSHVDVMRAQLPGYVPGHTQLSGHAQQSAKFETEQFAKNTSLTDFFASFVQLFSLRLPVLYTATATAALFIALLLLVRSPEMSQNRTVIATYQDSPTIQFTAKNKLPGIGFFAQSGDTSKPFEDIRIELISDDRIKISWPKIDGAELYKMRIQVFNQGKKTVLKEHTTQTNHTTFQLESEHRLSNSNKRYEWVLFGNTTDDRVFYASGGFVINQIHADDEMGIGMDGVSW